MTHSAGLGTERTVSIHSGQIRYWERGEGPPVLFVHGLLVNANLWRKVVPHVADAGFRCIAPDWPLGSHSLPMAEHADMTMHGVAKMIDDVLAALDLTDVTVVANDTGGALTQIAMVNNAERIGRVVLTPSDAFERMLPPMFGVLDLPKLATLPGTAGVLAAVVRPRRLYGFLLRRLGLVKRPIEHDIAASYGRSLSQDKGVRRDTKRFLKSVHRRHTLAAAARLGEFDKPVLLAWAREDVVFPIELAHRLAEVLPDARIEEIEDSYTLTPEDQPERVAELVAEFARAGRRV
ncbi:pimeloyl-ACP methyl ester carboxylesterase [Herbihabitans rhizosphaerae]|uniref:Pimeloyl-ACP methyl ester carboxylesterase n=1 Tax=Herbihabitans rhizosphaerae TaxID=1872711 RepID=A0A4Q7KWR7_9PSEU|nr:alpha/beta hydrolase [Herbihabitans rhizosphaerae]RZS40730.1 pimeloyl-ACP methyl ester carboxylesterase [Herbihabitans rhizosphaerae]